jgi:hypothetical protein
MSDEEEPGVIDTGAGGASLFGFTYVPQDELGAKKPPLRYGRCEFTAAGLDAIADGTITRVEELPYDLAPGGVAWKLTIATETDLSRVDANTIAVRLLT